MTYKELVCEAMSNYTFIKVSIDNMKYALAHEFEPRGLGAVCYDKDIVQTSDISSQTENEGIRLADGEAIIKKELKTNEILIRKLDKCLDALPKKHRQVVELKYIHGRSWKETADEMAYSISHCKRIHGNAIYKMTVGMYGFKAVNKVNKKTDN